MRKRHGKKTFRRFWNAVFLCLAMCAFEARAQSLTAADVQTIIAQAVSQAAAQNRPVTVAVTDREGNVLGIFAMTGAPANTLISGGGASGRGLEGVIVPAFAAAISKAGTPSFFSTTGNAFTTRTASFIIQEHFPPGVDFRPGGPLFGVQFSSLSCSDIKIPGLPLGLSGDAGGLPIYKNGVAVGGIGVEGDSLYSVDKVVTDDDQPFEEVVAVGGIRGYEAPAFIRGDQILIEGIRLPYANVGSAPTVNQIPFASLPGAIVAGFPIRAAQPSQFVPQTLGGIAGEVDPRFFPAVGSGSLSAAEVTQILTAGAQTANITRAGIRQPLGSNARVSISVVDLNGAVLGIFRQADAPVFGFDVSVQKARSTVFASNPNAAAALRTAGFGNYVDRAAADGIAFNGAIAFSDRGFGFLHRPFLPDGINDTEAGPLSEPLSRWSPFNVGLQLDLLRARLLTPPPMCDQMGMMIKRPQQIKGAMCRCTPVPNLPNGLQIFAGGIPLYKNGALVGAIGISGDGIEQDDFIAAGGANNFAPAVSIRSDQFFVRGVRLPFVKFPPRPTL